ncbi:MAG: Sulfoxide reductase catalytic subunit YedY [Anaerolineales bacterium]|nr:Sulfoxide reductase catalytic subunit YedY [Anaerolineales bacterium]
MKSTQASQMLKSAIESNLSGAEDSVRLGHWMPYHAGIVPQVRIGKRWFSVLWAIPIAFAAFLFAVAIAQQLRTLPAVQEFILRYPGDASPISVTSGFPLWLRLQHLFNAFFMLFIIRAGIQILADFPRLFLRRNCTPGEEWFRFQRDVPTDRLWTSKDDSVTIPGWLGVPGVRHSVGLARWWHFTFDLLWVLNGLLYYVLLFATDQWQRVTPTSWTVFPNALSTMIQYLSLNFPVEHTWTVYNGLQQLTYFITIFVAAPLAFITGVMQGPAFSNRLGGFAKFLNRQLARTIHFAVLTWFLFFVFTHTTLVFITGLRKNLNYMFAGVNDSSWAGVLIYIPVMLLLIAVWLALTPLTIKYARVVQMTGERFVGYIKSWAELWDPHTQYSEKDISPYFWVNGTLPVSEEYNRLKEGGFADYKIAIGGLVEKPQELSYAELKAMPKQEQITKHFCIQGWSGVAKWGGVPVRDILKLVKPRPEARYVVFYSFAEGADGGIYYDVHSLRNMRHKLSLLAYEMNGETLNFLHGAPLRLRCENQLGFKMVKWIRAIELVSDFKHLGAGHGGYNEDHEFYGYRMPI